jgi:hypothetical protein
MKDSAKKNRTYRRLATVFVGLFVFFYSGTFLLYPIAAHAIPVEETKAPVEEQILNALLAAVMGSLVNMASYFMRTLAYDAATYISSGGEGQGSLIFEKPFDEYLQNVALDSVGEAISSLGEEWGLNLCAPPNLKLQAQLKVGLDTTYQEPKAPGATGGRPQSKCSWQKLNENWKDGPFSNVEVGIDVAADFAGEVNVMETDFGFALGSITELDQFKTAQKEAAKIKRQASEGFKAVTDKVSGYVNTPPKLISEEATALTGKHQGELSAQQTAGMYASELWQIIPMSASVFLNTLTSQLLTRLFTEGIVPSEREKGQGAFDFYAVNAVTSKRQVAEQAFGFLTAKTGRKDPIEYNIVTIFSTCVPNQELNGINNCVMSQGIKDALDISGIAPVTLWEAVFEKGFISPSMPIINPRNETANRDQNCYKDKLCYSNIQKMRKARILPLGLEIAAKHSDADRPWTIGQVLEGFEDCPDPGPDGIKEDFVNYPFCHLVNPNWILRAPQARCENYAFSPELQISKSSDRKEECLDVSTCITEDEDGNCTSDNYYGYCTEEKNVWNIPGKSCEAEFATCKTFTNQETNSIVSYLTRTLEYGNCGPNAVGCRAYVTEKLFGEDSWIGTKDISVENKLYGRQQTLHFNERIAASGLNCPAEEDGCSKFIGAERDAITGAYIPDIFTGVYTQDDQRVRLIKQAPAYLGCYDTDNSPDSPEINYPTTLQQIENDIIEDPSCDAYAQVCVPEEVGCELYTPLAVGESVPGVVGGNFCPESCVGYSTFKQEKSSFEASVYPLYFIPPGNGRQSNAIECSSQHIGCDEFTNISSVETGGEGLEYYRYIKQCEVPDGTNSSVYYSWEGSESQGFILKVHTLAKVGVSTYFESLADAGQITSDIAAQFTSESPVYADDVPANLEENYSLCNETLYANAVGNIPDTIHANADCRALYDSEGNVYYRLLAETVTVSEACHPLRKTKSRLIVDESLIEVANTSPDASLVQTICTEKQGYWDTSLNEYSFAVCQRCAGGGAWVPEDSSNPEKGSCIYYAIDAPGESMSCPAEANGCREYTGNNGSNLKPIFENITDEFEPEDGTDADALNVAKQNWSPANSVNIAAESVQVNLHSLSIVGGPAGDIIKRSLPLDIMKSDSGESDTSYSSYELRFWARGAVQKVNIALEQGSTAWALTHDPITNLDIPVSIGTSWREYRVGPVTFTGTTDDPVFLVFDRQDSQTSGVYFLDNVSLYRTDGTKPLIKDSWKTQEGYDAPAECFATSQSPSGPFPGAALGCEAYSTSLGQKVYTTGFERLCREKAVGCAPLWDTQNTLAPYAEVYNALCKKGTFSSTGEIVETGNVDVVTDCTVTIDGEEFSCNIDARSDTCTIPGPIRIQNDNLLAAPAGDNGYIRIKETSDETISAGYDGFFALIDESSIYVSADTPEDSPLFLTDTPDSGCLEKHLGCELVAIEEQVAPDGNVDASYEYKEQTVINLPEQYLGPQGTLCNSGQIACSEFTTTDGATAFFKDPEVNANKLCEYKKPIGASTITEEGWYMKNVGWCSSDTSILCTTDDVCGEGNTCDGIGDIPCYEHYLKDFALYGIWSNGSPQYDEFVGECPVGQNMCTELVDPYDIPDDKSFADPSLETDTSLENQKGKPYYVIYDDRVTAGRGECQGQASLREGCVLFDKTDNPNKSYDATATYNESEDLAADGKAKTLVTPKSTEDNDANILLKVDKGRECSEWLSCKTYAEIFDAKGQKTKICSELSACVSTDGNECHDYAPKELDPEKAFLNFHNFINRDTSWFGQEPTGYSLYNKFQITDYEQLLLVRAEQQGLSKDDIADIDIETDVFYLGYKVPYAYLAETGQQDLCKPDNDWTSCGPDDKGRCISSSCVMPIDGKFGEQKATLLENISQAASDLGVPICKVPPEEDAPFSTNVVTPNDGDIRGPFNGSERKEFLQATTDANICQDGDCSCSYDRFTYKDGTEDFWSDPDQALFVYGICRGNFEKDGSYCLVDANCKTSNGEGGTCKPIDNLKSLVGSRGHCLEYDDSRPLTLSDGTQTFACLTWYPVDVSMSRVDNFNVFQDAGFDQTQDIGSDFSGLYCANATDPYKIVDEVAWGGGGGISNNEIVDWTEHQVSIGKSVLESVDVYEITDEGKAALDAIASETDYEEENLGFTEVFGSDPSTIPEEYIEFVDSLSTLPAECYGSDYMCHQVFVWEEDNQTLIADRRCYLSSMLGLGLTGDLSLFGGAPGGYCSGAHWYAAIQYWAHKKIGKTSLVLRSERAATRNIKFGDYHCQKNNSCSWNREEHFNTKMIIPRTYSQGGPDAFPIYNFVPRPHHYDVDGPPTIKDTVSTKTQNNKARGIQYVRSFGPMIYPPREWDSATDFSIDTSQKQMESLYSYGYPDGLEGWSYPLGGSYDDGFKNLNNQPLTINHLSPGPHYSLPDIKNEKKVNVKMNDVLYRSTYEAVMNEYDLDTVYFVPTAYTGGAQKFNPVLLDTHISIDFNILRTNADTEWNKQFDKSTADTDVLHMKKNLEPYFYEFSRVPATDNAWSVGNSKTGCRSYHHGNVGGLAGMLGDLAELTNTCVEPSSDPDAEAGLEIIVQCDVNGNPAGYVTEQCKPKPTDGAVLSYVIQNSTSTNYAIDLMPERISSNGSLDETDETLDDPRNIVHRRYVVIFFDEHENGNGELFAPWIPRIEGTNSDQDGKPQPPPSSFDIFSENIYGVEEVCYQNRNTNWFAIGMDFNKDGEFLGYLSRSCNDYSATFDDRTKCVGSLCDEHRDIWENGINMTVVAKVNEMCTDFVDVLLKPNGGPDEDTHKAWTNRLWSGSDVGVAKRPGYDQSPFFLWKKDTSITPYGSISLTKNKKSLAEDIAEPSTDPVGSLRTYALYFEPENSSDTEDSIFSKSGVPYLCKTAFMNGYVSNVDGNQQGLCNYDRRSSEVEDYVNEFNIPENIEDSRYAISMLFAKFYGRYTRKDNWEGGATAEGWLDTYTTSTKEYDYGDDFSNDTFTVPQIYSLNTDTCFSEGLICTPGEMHNFTISKQNGTLANYDKDENGLPDENPILNAAEPLYHLNKANFLAEATFFAMADDNHMPIRSININWGDGTLQHQGKKGFYKNKKPFCEVGDLSGPPAVGLCRVVGSSQSLLLPLTCKEKGGEAVGCPLDTSEISYECYSPEMLAEYDEDDIWRDIDNYDTVRFGNLSRSCEDGSDENELPYYSYSHVYSCDEGSIYRKPLSEWDDSYLSPYQKSRVNISIEGEDPEVCVYRPGVQVLDNWGWCNGSNVSEDLTQGGSDSAIIYKDFVNNLPAKVWPREEGWYSDRIVDDGFGGLEFYNDCLYGFNASWTYYKGVIIVAP